MSTYVMNGLNYYQPQGITYLLKSISHKEHLSAIANRLKNDVGFLIDTLEERNKKMPYKGFFQLVRLVMPVIEAVAKTEGMSPQDLLSLMGISKPYLTWSVYRDGFIHNDEFIFASYAENDTVSPFGVQSGLVFTNAVDDQAAADMLAEDGRLFDPSRIQRRLIEYLDKRIEQLSDDETVEIIDQIRFEKITAKTSQEVKRIIKEIKDVHDLS